MIKASKPVETRIAALSDGQRALLGTMIDMFEQPIECSRNAMSDIVSADFLTAFGDILKLHHSLSDDYLDKYRFEAAMQKVYRALGREASRPSRCFPGHDLTVDGIKWSLKTQGDASIKADILHISKFMELGKGKWETEDDLRGLRDRFLNHLAGYDRIIQLRYFGTTEVETEVSRHFYELVEIPKSLLREAANGEFTMMVNSKQSPKPGYCSVSDPDGTVRFKLYFDGGTERKLQIKGLRKDLCRVHATWCFTNST